MALYLIIRKAIYLHASVVLAMLLTAGPAEAVRIEKSVDFIEPIVGGGGAAAWSPDGRFILIATFNKVDRFHHLCIYSAFERKKIKCIYYLRDRPGIGIDHIDWTSDYIHVAVGFDEGATVVQRLPVPNWEVASFRELSLETYKALPKTYGYPAWDKWARGLFFFGEDERSGINFLPFHGHARKYVSGAYPAVTRNYVWYTRITGKDLLLDGLGIIEKKSGRKIELTSGHLDFSVTPRLDEQAAIFIRSQPETSGYSLHAIMVGQGYVTRPLLRADPKIGEEFLSVRLSPDGKFVLLTSSSAHNADRTETVTAVKLLSIRW